MEKANQRSVASVTRVPPPTNVDETGAPVDDVPLVHGKSLKEVTGGGDRTTLTAFASAFNSNKPTNFFELLAAAISAKKGEQKKVPDFLDYLQKSGIRMAWVRAIVALYEEPNKPDDPSSYILKLMGLGIPDKTDVKRMQDEVAHLRVKLLHLQAENLDLREAIQAEEEAQQKREELISLLDSRRFSEYNSDDDYTDAEEMQQKYSYTKQHT